MSEVTNNILIATLVEKENQVERLKTRIAELERLLVNGEVELKGNPLEIISKQRKRIAELEEIAKTLADKQWTHEHDLAASRLNKILEASDE